MPLFYGVLENSRRLGFTLCATTLHSLYYAKTTSVSALVIPLLVSILLAYLALYLKLAALINLGLGFESDVRVG